MRTTTMISLNSERSIETSGRFFKHRSCLAAIEAESDARTPWRVLASASFREAPMAHMTEDLAVTLEKDRPGTLAQAIGCVSAAGINIDGYSEMNGVVHVLTTDVKAARKCLHDAGFRIIQEQHVVLVTVEDEPGAAARVFQRIAEAHINVRYSYLATRNRLVIASDNPEAVIKAVSA